jgi:adenosylcobyric acid synthase
MTTPAIMVIGTSSHVGKSVLTAALCRIFAQRGYSVAPFKSQNMSLNSAATVEGLEIGRAQALQAEAAGILPSVHMNPILIKPTRDTASQIVVLGKIWGHLSAAEYHQCRVEELVPFVRDSYERLSAGKDVMVLEGAGSPAEINLKAHDIANMRMARLADAHCLLIGDIDRGGVFASLLGTVELLDVDERARIQGFVINKFRGDMALLLPGIRQIEERLGKPCLGVVPYIEDLTLEEEDSVGLSYEAPSDWIDDDSSSRKLRIAVVSFPSLANFTDFDPLLGEPSVSLRFCRTAKELRGADIVILPGSKQTVNDLRWLRERGIDEFLYSHAVSSLTVGICGGMQMLGKEIVDTTGIETKGTAQGLGLLAIHTEMQPEKITVNVSGELLHSRLFGHRLEINLIHGYEIHIGKTTCLSGASSFAKLIRPSPSDIIVADGCVSDDSRTWGTYLHGIFDTDSFRHDFIRAARAFHHLAPPCDLFHWKEHKEMQLNDLARTVGCALDLERIFGWLGLPLYKQGPSRAAGEGVHD